MERALMSRSWMFAGLAFFATVTGGVSNAADGYLNVFSVKRLNTDSSDYGYTSQVSFSSDGKRVAFTNNSNEIDGILTHPGRDVFVKDLTTGIVKLVSSDKNGIPGDGESHSPSISPDGKRIAFFSYASNILENDTDNLGDIFIKDIETGEIQAVSVGLNGKTVGGWNPVFDWSGQKVAFLSTAANLVSGYANKFANIYVRDLTLGKTVRVSTSIAGAQANGDTRDPVFSPNGKKIAFSSFATNLVPSDKNHNYDVFLKDLDTGRVQIVSAGTFGLQGNGSSGAPTFSGDGTKIAFSSLASNWFPGIASGHFNVFVKDLRSKDLIPVSVKNDGSFGDSDSFIYSASSNSALSFSGDQILFTTYSTNLAGPRIYNIYRVILKNLDTGILYLAGKNKNGQLAVDSENGGFIKDTNAFWMFSGASNLSPGDEKFDNDVFVLKYKY